MCVCVWVGGWMGVVVFVRAYERVRLCVTAWSWCGRGCMCGLPPASRARVRERASVGVCLFLAGVREFCIFFCTLADRRQGPSRGAPVLEGKRIDLH